jgi:hypothetical protein
MKEEKKPEGSAIGGIITLVCAGFMIYYCVKLFLL